MTMTTTTLKIKKSDLAKLSQEDLAALTSQALKIKEAAKNKRQDIFLANAYPEQIEFLKSKKRGRGFLGGNRTGKSSVGMNELVWRCMGTHPFQKCKIPIKAVVILQDFENHCKNIFEPKLNEWAPPSAIESVERNQTGAIRKIIWKGGSTTDVLSHDQDLKVFEGADYDMAWFDEPPPHSIFKAVARGLTDRGGIWFITATPLTDPWLYHSFKDWENDKVASMWEFWVVRMEKNAKNLGEGDLDLGMRRIQEFLSLLDPEEKEARGGGTFMQLQGLIFKSWTRAIHLIKPFDWPHKWPIIESIDPHPRKPAGVSWIGIAENGARILLRSAYIEGDMYELAHQIVNHRDAIPLSDNDEGKRRPQIIRSLIDNAANAPLTGASQTSVSRERISMREEIENIIGPRGSGGPRIECPPKNVSGKIDALKSWLTIREREDGRKRADYYVMNNRENEDFVNEIENYAWQRFKARDRNDFKDQPVKKNDDILDSVMQVALVSRPRHFEATEPSVIFKSLGTYGL